MLPGRAAVCAGGAMPASGLWHKSAESERDPLPDGWADTDSAILGRPPLAQSVFFLPVVTRMSDNPVTGYPQISRNRKCDRGEIRIGKGCRMYRKNPSSRLRGGFVDTNGSVGTLHHGLAVLQTSANGHGNRDVGI